MFSLLGVHVFPFPTPYAMQPAYDGLIVFLLEPLCPNRCFGILGPGGTGLVAVFAAVDPGHVRSSAWVLAVNSIYKP